MTQNKLSGKIETLAKTLDGEIHQDSLHKKMYATDASVYKHEPLAVAFPKTEADIKQIIEFARQNKIGIIPRTAGTSLAGQCVGKGIVVDVSKYFTKIIHLDKKQKTVTVQPGVIRDELNRYLEKEKLFFGPNTSTSNRCMIGGMVGNNSSGTTSIQYGVTSDKVKSLTVLLSDGSHVSIKPNTEAELQKKCGQHDLEGNIYQKLVTFLSEKSIQEEIKTGFPNPTIHRRNTGYAVDKLLKQKPFDASGADFNLAQLICGSEGTLAFITEITLELDPLPPKHSVMIAAHFKSISEAMQTVVPVMEFPLYTCELIDKTILDCTRYNLAQQKNRFFIEGNPKAILLLELRENSNSDLEIILGKLIEKIQSKGKAYAYPVLREDEIQAANSLRSAGLGLLGNMVGDAKTVACIEDTAVPIDDLAAYIDEFSKLMDGFNQKPVYYAHAGAGELHLRPVLNLKTTNGVSDFRAITLAVAKLVKKYNGSLSGEHGDGIVRSEFIPLVLGEENYQLFKKIKTLFDPENIFNPGKIVDPYPMDKNLRYVPDQKDNEIKTLFDFSADMGMVRAVEKCNGSGDCRTVELKGTMCPSYRATKDEKDSTRARANVLREVLSAPASQDPFNNEDIKEVLDLCLSCKACVSECPSSVDMATYKAEFLYHYHKANGHSLRDFIFAYTGGLSRWSQAVRGFQNGLFSNNTTGNMVKRMLGIHIQRSFPKLEKPLHKRIKNQANKRGKPIKKVYLYADEFTNYFDTQVGQDAIVLLKHLNYEVHMLSPTESGRTYISKGFLKQAKKCVERNLKRYGKLVTEETPLIGIEPSALYTFIDEYPKLSHTKRIAEELAKNTYLIDAFIATEIKNGNIKETSFHAEAKEIKFHAHCYQKVLGNPQDTLLLLNLPKNYRATLLNTGCCGMAGSFGYEKEHYELSMKIGEERLFPRIKKQKETVCIAANGTSCRHQIMDGTERESWHPISILRQALVS